MKSETEIESSDQHVVNAVEFMLQHAFESRASDIHVEPKREDSLIRFRIDGVLHDIQKMPKIVHAAVTSRIKTMSRLDIAEKRRPQDGRVKMTRAGREVELRVSTLPVAFGEKMVMRIFDPQVVMQDLSGLGFYPDELSDLQRLHHPAPRHHPGDRPHRLGQDDDPLLGAQDHLHARDQRHHDRGPDRDGLPGLQPDRGAAQGGHHLRRRPAPHPAPGPGRHHGRRDPRRRDGAVRHPGGADRPPRLLHPPHQRRGLLDLPPDRPRRRALPDQLDRSWAPWPSASCAASARTA